MIKPQRKPKRLLRLELLENRDTPAPITFTIDPTQSTLALGGQLNLLGAELNILNESQYVPSGAPSTTIGHLTGSIAADLDPSPAVPASPSIQFVETPGVTVQGTNYSYTSGSTTVTPALSPNQNGTSPDDSPTPSPLTDPAFLAASVYAQGLGGVDLAFRNLNIGVHSNTIDLSSTGGASPTYTIPGWSNASSPAAGTSTTEGQLVDFVPPETPNSFTGNTSVPAADNPIAVTGATWSSSTATTSSGTWTPTGSPIPETFSYATVTTSAPTGFYPGETVDVAGIAPSGFNGIVNVTSTPTPNTFTYTVDNNPGTYQRGGYVNNNDNDNYNVISYGDALGIGALASGGSTALTETVEVNNRSTSAGSVVYNASSRTYTLTLPLDVTLAASETIPGPNNSSIAVTLSFEMTGQIVATGTLSTASAPVFTSPTQSSPVGKDEPGSTEWSTLGGNYSVGSFSIPSGTSTVGTVQATGATSYSIVSGRDSSLFTINPTTGVLSFITPPNYFAPLDGSRSNDYQVVVQASNGQAFAGQTLDTIQVTVTPPVSEGTYSVTSSSFTLPDGGLTGQSSASSTVQQDYFEDFENRSELPLVPFVSQLLTSSNGADYAGYTVQTGAGSDPVTGVQNSPGWIDPRTVDVITPNMPPGWTTDDQLGGTELPTFDTDTPPHITNTGNAAIPIGPPDPTTGVVPTEGAPIPYAPATGANGAANPYDFVEEYGFNVLNTDSWSGEQQPYQNRPRAYDLGIGYTGTALIAESDGYDDGAAAVDPTTGTTSPTTGVSSQAHGDLYNTYVSTPFIPLSNVNPGTLKLDFDSSSAFSGYPTRAQITAVYVAGTNPDGSPNITGSQKVLDMGDDGVAGNVEQNVGFDPADTQDNGLSDHVSLALNAPGGTTGVFFEIDYINSGNDYWWALDNIAVSNSEAVTTSLVTQASHGTAVVDPNGGFTYTPTPGYSGPDSFTYQAKDPSGNALGSTTTVNLNVVPSVTPPTVTAAPVINGGGTGNVQRSLVTSLTVTFSEPVSIAPGAFTLTRQSDGSSFNSALTGAISVSNPLGDHETFVLTFTGAATTIENNSLADGVYVLNINKTLVTGGTTGTGPAMTTDYNSPTSGANRVYRLFGDFNGDGSVNGADFAAFAAAYNAGPNDPNYKSYFDFTNSDQGINSADFTQFSDRYGTSL